MYMKKLKSYVLSILAGIFILAVIGYLVLASIHRKISYQCEDGERFTIEKLSSSQIKMVGSDYSVVLSNENYPANIMTVYGDDKDAITYTVGYGTQVIRTHRSNDATSTPCSPI